MSDFSDTDSSIEFLGAPSDDTSMSMDSNRKRRHESTPKTIDSSDSDFQTSDDSPDAMNTTASIEKIFLRIRMVEKKGRPGRPYFNDVFAIFPNTPQSPDGYPVLLRSEASDLPHLKTKIL